MSEGKENQPTTGADGRAAIDTRRACEWGRAGDRRDNEKIMRRSSTSHDAANSYTKLENHRAGDRTAAKNATREAVHKMQQEHAEERQR